MRDVSRIGICVAVRTGELAQRSSETATFQHRPRLVAPRDHQAAFVGVARLFPDHLFVRIDPSEQVADGFEYIHPVVRRFASELKRESIASRRRVKADSALWNRVRHGSILPDSVATILCGFVLE